jgi:peptidoglycan/xylan/chitin deacetylase (PgdA/CDA1 family)
MAALLVALAFSLLAPQAVPAAAPCEIVHGGVVRGPRDRARVALAFTAHEHGEGLATILDLLASARAKGSFFFTGDFLRRSEYEPLIRRAVAEGHLVGPHSDRHLLYAAWEDRRTLVTRDEFARDLLDNLRELERFGVRRASLRWWMPPYEWYSADIARWSAELGVRVMNFTPGTRTNADYLGESEPRFLSSAAILDTVRVRLREDPDAMNGYVLLVHAGVGPGRRDKFVDNALPSLIELLRARHDIVRVDALLEACA